jgi:PilZ domain
MDDLLESFKKPPQGSLRERRRHPRKVCNIKANYMAQGHWHKGCIRNISDGGAYISSIRGKQLSPSEEIFLVAKIRVLRHQLRGKIAWVGPHVMGVEFQTAECG